MEDYLYVPENIISGVEPPSKVETPFGRPSGKYTEESGSVTNEITNTEPKTPDDNENENTHVGHVIIAKPGRTRKSEEDENSEMLGTGHSRKRSRTKGGIQMGGHNFSSSVVDEGETGNYSQYIPVRFRVVAQKDYGKIYHSIIFHSPVATNRGEIELQVGGELNDEILDIIETSHGENRGNFITKLNVVEGKNIIRVRFNDNIKHAVILKAYEHK